MLEQRSPWADSGEWLSQAGLGQLLHRPSGGSLAFSWPRLQGTKQPQIRFQVRKPVPLLAGIASFRTNRKPDPKTTSGERVSPLKRTFPRDGRKSSCASPRFISQDTSIHLLLTWGAGAAPAQSYKTGGSARQGENRSVRLSDILQRAQRTLLPPPLTPRACQARASAGGKPGRSWQLRPEAGLGEGAVCRKPSVTRASELEQRCPDVMGPDVMILVFWMLSCKPTFSLSSFTFIKRLFSSSSLSAIRVVSSAYLRLLIFLLAILIPVCASSSSAFLKMYSA